MRQDQIFEVIKSPLVTEKTTRLAELSRQYVFAVHQDATKTLVKKAVEKIFNVKVSKVAVINIAGKTKRFKGVVGKRNNIRKAIVTVAVGQEINTSGVL